MLFLKDVKESKLNANSNTNIVNKLQNYFLKSLKINIVLLFILIFFSESLSIWLINSFISNIETFIDFYIKTK